MVPNETQGYYSFSFLKALFQESNQKEQNQDSNILIRSLNFSLLNFELAMAIKCARFEANI